MPPKIEVHDTAKNSSPGASEPVAQAVVYGKWSALTTHRHRELLAIEQLTRQGFKVYCPFLRKQVRHARRSYDAPRPMFPGYAFIKHPQSEARWRPILSTIGVKTVLMIGGRPGLLPAGFVENLKAREIEGVICKPQDAFRIGQQVTIQGGPFDGLIGQICDLRENDRVIVLLDLLNRQTAVHVGAKQLA